MLLRILLLSCLLLALTISALGVVYSKHESRRLFIALQSEIAARDELNVEWGRLQLEQSTWQAHARLEDEARERLRMVMPGVQSTVIIKP